MARRDALSVDVPKNATNRALQHVAAEASGGLATVECRLDGIGDGVHHGIHGRYGVSHVLLPCSSPTRSPASVSGERPCRGRRDQSPASTAFLLFPVGVSGERVRDNVLSEK